MNPCFIGYTLDGKDYAIFLYYGAIGVSHEIAKVFVNQAELDKYYKRAVKYLKAGTRNDNPTWEGGCVVKDEFKGGKVWIRKINSHKNPFLFLDVDPKRPRVPIKPKCSTKSRAG
jgi:hypothetical protein